MHTFKVDDVAIVYNSDLSGDVVISAPGGRLMVPAAALVAFVADAVRRERIAAAEGASPAELLGLRPR